MKHWLCIFAAALIVSFITITIGAGLVLLIRNIIMGVGAKLFFGAVAVFATALLLAIVAQGGLDETQ